MVPTLVNNQSLAEVSTIPTEVHTTAPEHHMKVIRRCVFIMKLTVGRTKTTRRLHGVVLRVRCVRIGPEGVTEPSDVIKP